MNNVPGFFLLLADSEKCVQIARRLGFDLGAHASERAREMMDELINQTLGSYFEQCSVGSFADFWRALTRAKAGDEGWRTAAKSLCYSVEDKLQEAIGGKYAAAQSEEQREANMREFYARDRACLESAKNCSGADRMRELIQKNAARRAELVAQEAARAAAPRPTGDDLIRELVRKNAARNAEKARKAAEGRA